MLPLILFNVFREISEMHIPFARQRIMHRKGCSQVVTCLSHLSYLQIVTQQGTIIRMSTVLNDDLSTLCRTLASQVGHTLFCHDDIDVML